LFTPGHLQYLKMFSSPLRLFPLFPNNVFSLPLNEFILFLPAKFQIITNYKYMYIFQTNMTINIIGYNQNGHSLQYFLETYMDLFMAKRKLNLE